MNVLSLAALYPPFAHGGAEMSARNLASWLHTQGHRVTVMTSSPTRHTTVDTPSDGPQVMRMKTPHIYPVYDFPNRPAWQKIVFHTQDYCDARNVETMRSVVDQVKPDVALVHLVPGLGYNSLRVFAERDVPVVYYLPDLGLACLRASMFRKGVNCTGLCAPCHVTRRLKIRLLSAIPRVGLCSPSRANRERLARYFPVADYPNTVILNANRYPTTSCVWAPAPHLRLLYVGRLHPQKGVDMLIEAVARLAHHQRVALTIIGGGPQESVLREKFGHYPWLVFTGKVEQQVISDQMRAHDLLCVPSLWQENAPGVVIHALSLGLPVLASHIGGLPEFVDDGRTGGLVAQNDVDGWYAQLNACSAQPERLALWRQQAGLAAAAYDADTLGAQHMAFIQRICDLRPRGSVL